MNLNNRKTAKKVVAKPTIALSELERIKQTLKEPIQKKREGNI